ncbi:nucleotidyltransferase domain-containing protein [Alishewanella sp. BS5-314]|uniref:type VII toxin-antitoxin system MntA family adenylyltransferase antitoxin n=1 Tax=Alishewanella sp. BS5-314 TaxID=2755587 RepID=UPI0021BB1BD1|nr:nucleotidyltransferase domain-containing protein [Alishewanella sp. BS5-314]MCT8126112.1 nucleotidyltransferase domain-containing protein [Alishewanella sp. BS5-314]
MTNSEPTISRITQLAKQNADIGAIWLYGSRVQGRARPDSDYDLAVAFNDFALDNLARYNRPHCLALDWAAELALPEAKISIVDINQAPIYLAYQIIDTGQLIYSDGSARAWQEITRINSLFEYQQREASHEV